MTEKKKITILNQIKCISVKIQKILQHLQKHKKDKHTKLGLLHLINLKKKLQRYYNRSNIY